jgi:outer membrane PBP1 activator LpoA protein
MIKTILEIFKTYWGYAMTLVAAASFVWTLGVKSERKDNEKLTIKKDITQIIITQKLQTQTVDSLFNIVSILKNQQKQVIDGQNAMRTSYVQYLSKDKNLTKEDFIKYMNGLEFQMVPLPLEKSVGTKQEYKIKVTPVKPSEKEKNEY